MLRHSKTRYTIYLPNANWMLMRAGLKQAEGSKPFKNPRNVSRISSGCSQTAA
jgi:hypothetical protein